MDVMFDEAKRKAAEQRRRDEAAQRRRAIIRRVTHKLFRDFFETLLCPAPSVEAQALATQAVEEEFAGMPVENFSFRELLELGTVVRDSIYRVAEASGERVARLAVLGVAYAREELAKEAITGVNARCLQDLCWQALARGLDTESDWNDVRAIVDEVLEGGGSDA